ncbi:MAG: HAD family phosphatase [Candidatus Nanopelagicales bacterium]
MSAPVAAVFDLGGVVIDWEPRRLYRTLFGGDDGAMEQFLETVCTPEWNAEQDRGRSLAEGTELLLELHPESSELIRAFYARWREMLGGEIPGTVRILEELDQRGVALFAMTNWSAETFPFARENFRVLRRFRGILVSGEELLSKPDPAFFALLAQRFAVEPERTVFIDDSPGNVEVSRRLGYVGLQFSSPERLRADLVSVGVLEP